MTISPTAASNPLPVRPDPERHPVGPGRKVAIAALKVLSVLSAVFAAFFAFVSANLAIIGLPVVWGGLMPTAFFTGASLAAREAARRLSQVG